MNSSVPLSAMDRFLASFFNAEVAARYVAPMIDGMLLTIGLGLCVIATGLVLGLALAVLRIQHVKLINGFIIAFADIFRALPPLVVIILLFFAFPYIELSMSAFTATWLALSLVLAAFTEEIFWVHAGHPQGAMGSGTLHRHGLLGNLGPCDLAASGAHDGAAADQPHDRHHQGHGAGIGGGAARGAQCVIVRFERGGQRHPTGDGRGGLFDFVHPLCGVGALG